jgi:hypothetical protein
MQNLISFLMKSTSLITVVIPLLLCSFLLICECLNPKTDKKYFLYFFLVLFVSSIMSRWEVKTYMMEGDVYYSIGLHIMPIFLILLCCGLARNWEISVGMATVFAYMEGLIIDVSQSYTTSISELLMDKTNIDVFNAHQLAHDVGEFYNGIGGGGFHDFLFLSLIYPALMICFFKGCKYTFLELGN